MKYKQMINKLKAKKEELNKEINKKSKEYEKAFREAEKTKLHTELKILEGEYKACVDIIKMLEEQNESKF